MGPATGDQKKSGLIYHFKMDEFVKSLPHENVQYIQMLQQTQGTSIYTKVEKWLLIKVRV